MEEVKKTNNHEELKGKNEKSRAKEVEIISDDEPQLPARGLQVIAGTMNTIADAQEAVLNSQQSNRDLINVVVQDNFKLKEENSKLRDRMLELERDLSEVQRHDGEQIKALEERITLLESSIERSVVPRSSYGEYSPQGTRQYPPPRQERRGCLAQIFGM